MVRALDSAPPARSTRLEDARTSTTRPRDPVVSPPVATTPPPALTPAPPAARPDPQRSSDARIAHTTDVGTRHLEHRVRESYRVRAGDTLTGIARDHGVSLERLLTLNPEQRQTPDVIHPGEKLVVPRTTREPTTRVRVESGDTLTSIAERHDTDVADLVRINPNLASNPDLIHAGDHVAVAGRPKPVVSKPEPTEARKPGPTEKPIAPPAPTEKPIAPPALRPQTLETTEHAILATLPHTRTGATLAERAGYTGPSASQARFQDVEVVTPAGQVETRRLLPFVNAKNVWADEKGTEYYLAPTTTRDANGRERKRYTIANEQPSSTADATIRATQLPAGSFLVPSLGMDARDRKQQLEAQGYEVTAVLGTGFIDSGGKSIVGYQYVNEARLRGENAPADAGKSVDGLGSGKIHAGYRVTRGGEMQLVDFEGLDRTQVRAKLRALEADPDTAAINLFAHVAADEPKDLVGVLGATTEPTAVGKARSMLVFDKEGALVGHLQTPPTSLLDSVTLARQVYGDRAAKVLNQDGDFYAQSWFADGRPGSSDRALHYDNAVLVVRGQPTAAPKAPQDQPFWAPVTRAAADLGYWFDENVVDNVRDAGQELEQKRDDVGASVGRWWNDTAEWWRDRLPR